jgi:S1-C subfamily serine protease
MKAFMLNKLSRFKYAAAAFCGAFVATLVWHSISIQSPVQAQLPSPAPPVPVLPPTVPNGVKIAPAGEAPAPSDAGTKPINPADYTPDELVNIKVYETVNRSVVNLSTKVANQNGILFGEQVSEGAGSGSVLDTRGHILTNYHVVEGAREIEVTLYDGNSYDAKIVGADPNNDTAVIKIDAPANTLIPIQFGDSSNLRVGQRVLAIGNPFGLERTLTTGIVSSLNRSLPTRNGRTIKSIIQIDAAINPGNSGGPLLNNQGQMIGMNTAIASRTGQNTGVGFTIPINTIKPVVPELIASGRVARPETGISRVYQTEKGLLIATVTPDGPADKAGLRGIQVVRQQKRDRQFVYETQTVDRSKADLIIGVNGKRIKTADEFLTTIETFKPGNEVTLNIIREGREMTARLKLGGGD